MTGRRPNFPQVLFNFNFFDRVDQDLFLPGKEDGLINLSDFLWSVFWHQMRGFFSHASQLFSTNWVSSNFSSDANYPELAQTPRIKGSAPQDCLHLRDRLHRVCLGCPHFCPADYKFRGSHKLPLRLTNSQNSGNCFTYYCWFIIKSTTQKQLDGIDTWGTARGRGDTAFHATLLAPHYVN